MPTLGGRTGGSSEPRPLSVLLPTGHRDSHELLCEITAEPVYQSNQRHRVSGSGSRSLGPRDGGDCDDPPQGPAGGEGDGPPGCGVCSPLWDPGFVSQHLSPKFSRLFHPDSFLLNRELKEKKKKSWQERGLNMEMYQIVF